MKTWIIVRKEDLEVLGSYESEEKRDSSAHGNYTHVEPIACHVDAKLIDARWAKAEMQDIMEEDVKVGEEVVIVEDSDKRDAVEDTELAQAWDNLRRDRDERLKETDHTMLSDYPMTEQDKTDMEDYRQALRDFPSSVTDPRDEYTLPTKP